MRPGSDHGCGQPRPARDHYARAYASPSALTAGFNWYRKLHQDGADNASATGTVSTPVLYLRGEHEIGDVGAHVGGHFAPEDAPDAVWSTIARFAVGEVD